MERLPINNNDIKALAMLTKMIYTWGKDDRIRQIAAGIVSQRDTNGSWVTREWDFLNTIDAVYKWVDSRVRYTPDPVKADIFETPLKTLELKIADCDGYLILIGSLLQAIGYPVIVSMTSQSRNEPLGHVYLLVGTPPLSPPKDIRAWIPIDAITNKPIGWQPPYAYGIWRQV